MESRQVSRTWCPLRQRDNRDVTIQRLHHPEAGPDLGVACRRRPAEMRAGGLREFSWPSLGNSSTVSWMSAICYRPRRQSGKVAALMSMIRWSMGDSRVFLTTACGSPGARHGGRGKECSDRNSSHANGLWVAENRARKAILSQCHSRGRGSQENDTLYCFVGLCISRREP